MVGVLRPHTHVVVFGPNVYVRILTQPLFLALTDVLLKDLTTVSPWTTVILTHNRLLDLTFVFRKMRNKILRTFVMSPSQCQMLLAKTDVLQMDLTTMSPWITAIITPNRILDLRSVFKMMRSNIVRAVAELLTISLSDQTPRVQIPERAFFYIPVLLLVRILT